MRFTADADAGLAAGTTTVTFRTWARPVVRVGGTYRVRQLALRVDAMSRVRAGDITTAQARAAGEADVAAVLRRLKGPAPGTLVWRVDFHLVDEPDPRRVLAAQGHLEAGDVSAIEARLGRLDRASRHGPWTMPTLRAIEAHPATVSTELAADLERERFALKADIRKLKALGLTESLAVGYQLSPRGRAYVTAQRFGPNSSTRL